ncbi:hypothetical protein BKI52_32055 [marine bacterium AO1-C]|nr:hypothetical protein BKI52_32055 [marine bacterium AO1-C]
MLIGLVVVNTQAQELSKAEKKALKKEAKDLYKNPAKLKILKDAKDKANQELESNKKEILKLKAAQHDFEQRESVMLSTIDSLSARLKRAKDKIKELENRKPVAAANPTVSTGTVAGVVFKVQVGAYKGGSIGTSNGGTDYTNENADGYNKHLLGSFKQYQPAKSFADHLERLGIKGAWVVAFKDGNRISIKEALGGTSSDTPKKDEVNTDGGK